VLDCVVGLECLSDSVEKGHGRRGEGRKGPAAPKIPFV
jgi:hypothetical protein